MSRKPSPLPSPIRWERVSDLSAVALAKAEGRVRVGPFVRLSLLHHTRTE